MLIFKWINVAEKTEEELQKEEKSTSENYEGISMTKFNSQKWQYN